MVNKASRKPNHHLTKNHLNQKPSALKDRVERGRGNIRFRRASSYRGQRAAIKEIARTLEQGRGEIRSWLSNASPAAPKSLTLFSKADRNSGYLYRGGDRKAAAVKTNVVVLKRKRRGYYLHNAYPTDRTPRQLRRDARNYLTRRSAT